jgi:hypothetical protein
VKSESYIRVDRVGPPELVSQHSHKKAFERGGTNQRSTKSAACRSSGVASRGAKKSHFRNERFPLGRLTRLPETSVLPDRCREQGLSLVISF